eukprot:3038457-Pyramimonas_sp.AAC.1
MYGEHPKSSCTMPIHPFSERMAFTNRPPQNALDARVLGIWLLTKVHAALFVGLPFLVAEMRKCPAAR